MNPRHKLCCTSRKYDIATIRLEFQSFPFSLNRQHRSRSRNTVAQSRSNLRRNAARHYRSPRACHARHRSTNVSRFSRFFKRERNRRWKVHGSWSDLAPRFSLSDERFYYVRVLRRTASTQRTKIDALGKCLRSPASHERNYTRRPHGTASTRCIRRIKFNESP